MSSQTSVWDRFTSVIAAHKTAIFVGSLVVIGSSAGAYYSLQQSYGSESDLSRNGSSKKGKKKHRSKHEKKKLRKAREADESGSPSEPARATILGFNLTKDETNGVEYPDIEDFEVISDLDLESRQKLAHAFKIAGNEYYGKKKLELALEMYAKSLKCHEDAILYSNQAACYLSLKQYENVIVATKKALELQPENEKAMIRSATANEHLGNLREAIYDYSSALILTNFQNQNLNTAVDRVISLCSTQEAEKLLANRPDTIRNDLTIASIFRSYGNHETPEGLNDVSSDSDDYDTKLGFDAIHSGDYSKAYDHFKVSSEKNGEFVAYAYLYMAIFTHVLGRPDESLEFVKRSIDLKPTVMGYVLRANFFLDQSNSTAAALDFKNALKLDINCAFIYHHLAQMEFIGNMIDDAIEHYSKALELDPTLVYSDIQIGVSYYRLGEIDKAKSQFDDLERKHPESFEVYNYYGEILTDLREFDAAIAKFKKSIELAKPISVQFANVPLVNLALAVFQSHPEKYEESIKLCEEAIANDEQDSLALGTLAQIYLHLQEAEKAHEYHLKTAANAGSLTEVKQQLALAEATITQLRIAKDRPFLKKRLDDLVAKNAGQY